MSKSKSGLFSGTMGSNKNTGIEEQFNNEPPNKAAGQSDSESSYKAEEQSNNEPSYKATEDLKNHIVNSEPTTSGNDGIKGAHHKDNFLNEVDRIGAQVTGSTPSTQIDGVETITYKMPKKDKYGKPTGDYKAKSFTKTVFDPSKITTDTYIERGLQAANNAAKSSPSGKLGREWTGTDNQNVKWHGYCNGNDEITSFYPEY